MVQYRRTLFESCISQLGQARHVIGCHGETKTARASLPLPVVRNQKVFFFCFFFFPSCFSLRLHLHAKKWRFLVLDGVRRSP